MGDNVLKIPRSVSPVARAGAGDISERELSREQHTLQFQMTPPARLQPVHPKKQLFLTPVSKFTGSGGSTPHLARIRSCLEELTAANTRGVVAPARKMPPKSSSMEDLTPAKRMKKENPSTDVLPVIRSPCTGAGVDVAGARVARFMVVCAWRRRRSEVRCLRKTLEFQLSCSERLRMQVAALKSLLDSDNAKVRLAMRELDRLKQLVQDKEKEKAVLEREKIALEDDVCAAEDRASEMSIGWRNCRNELEGVRAAAARADHELMVVRDAGAEARAERDTARNTLSETQQQLDELLEELAEEEEKTALFRSELENTQHAYDDVCQQLTAEQNGRLACGLEIASLNHRVSRTDGEVALLKAATGELRAQLDRAHEQLRVAQEQLDWWPKPLTRFMGAMRWWASRPGSLRAAVLWSCVPPTHGATHLTRSLFPL